MLYNRKDLNSNSPIGTSHMPQRASVPASETSGTTGSADPVAQVAEQLSQQPEPVTEFVYLFVFLSWAPLKTSSFSDPLANGLELHTQMRTVLPPKSEETQYARCCLSISVVERAIYNKVSFP